jgi:hypothetical protein
MADVEKFVSCWIDAEDDFGVVNANDTSAVGLSVIEGSVQIAAEREALAEDSVGGDHGKWSPVEGSASGSTFGFSTRAGGLGDISTVLDGVQGADDGELPAADDYGPAYALRSLFNGMVAVAGDTVDADPAPSVAAFQLATQTTLDAALVILLVETVNHGFQVIPVSIEDGLCTCLLEPPSAPKVAGAVWGSLNFPLVESLALTNSFQGKFISDTTGHKYRILGGMVNQATLSLSARQLPKLECQALMNSWAVITDTLTSIRPPVSMPWMDATFRMAMVGSPEYNADQIHKVKGECQFTFMRGLQPEDDPNHPEGASGYDEDFTDSFCKFSPVIPFSRDWHDNFGLNNGKSWDVLAASTRVPGRGVAVYGRGFVQSTWPKPVGHNGMNRVQPEFMLGSGYTQPGCVLAVF